MRIWMVILIASVLSVVSQGEATPPREVTLAYDVANKQLLITIEHPTRNFNRHYIKKITVTKNEEKPENIFLTRQPDPVTFTQTVPLVLKKGDVVLVKVQCGNGGSAEATLAVTDEVLKLAAPVPVATAPEPTMNETKESGY